MPDLKSAGFSGTAETAKQGNCRAHGLEGQNVMFLDTHVTFEKRAYCGLEGDNIYLVSRFLDRGDPLGVVPMCPSVNIQSRRDSVLVHDPPYLSGVPEVTTTIRQAQEVNSKDLKRTAVVATLDCPLPEHKNAIWCATFQMAWDKFKRDVVGEPILLRGAEELAGRLNRREYPTADIEAESYYAAAGFVKNGIIEQIQRDMKRHFPAEPVPTFDMSYRTMPKVATAYAYLNVNVGFEYPYYTYLSGFDFADSTGTRAAVTAFCAHTSVHQEETRRIREQVEVLHYDFGPSPETVEFAVDLSKQTQPYAVVLACVPRCNTLGEAAKALQGKIAAFKNDPDCEVLHKLRPIDTLIVPDVLYKLTHHFDELLGKYLGNAKWQDSYIFDACRRSTSP